MTPLCSLKPATEFAQPWSSLIVLDRDWGSHSASNGRLQDGSDAGIVCSIAKSWITHLAPSSS